MRLDHLLSRESDMTEQLVWSIMDKGNEFQYCSILKAMRMDLQGIRAAYRNAERHGGIAQLGEHLLCKQGVKGSNPFISTIRCIEIFLQEKISETSHPAKQPNGCEVGFLG